eukprot:g83442.t1
MILEIPANLSLLTVGNGRSGRSSSFVHEDFLLSGTLPDWRLFVPKRRCRFTLFALFLAPFMLRNADVAVEMCFKKCWTTAWLQYVLRCLIEKSSYESCTPHKQKQAESTENKALRVMVDIHTEELDAYLRARRRSGLRGCVLRQVKHFQLGQATTHAAKTCYDSSS